MLREIVEMFGGPMGGDQRNMRGSSSRKDKDPYSGKWDGESVTVYLLNFDSKEIAKEYNVKIRKSDDIAGPVKIYGEKKDVKDFLISQGWSATDLKKWYSL